jgi:hypothetical protein
MSAKLPIHERFIALLDAYPWSALYRIGLGYVISLLYYRMLSKDDSGWFLVLWFLSLLIALRLLPAVFRKVLPLSREVKAIWEKRRQAAKRYDSYQWRKLIWFGIGMACYVGISGIWNVFIGTLAAFCIISGGLGFIFWRYRSATENVIIE